MLNMDAQAFKFTFFSNFFEPKSENRIEFERKIPIETIKTTEKRKILGQIGNSNSVPKKFRPVTERNYRIPVASSGKLNSTRKINSEAQPIRCKSYLQNRKSIENLETHSNNHLPKINKNIKLLPVIHHYKKVINYPEDVINSIKFNVKHRN